MSDRDETLGVRVLARQAKLATYFEQAPDTERRRLRAQAYELLHPLVFTQLTRRVEARRGHRDCMVSVRHLRPDCLDRFHNDMDAVLDDLFSHSRVPIKNLEGWVSRRLHAVTIDAHRRRRGERGALQRPRIPRWLARELGEERRLMDLAIEMLEWAGVETSAGTDDWPIEIWSSQRAAAGGDDKAGETSGRAAARELAQDVATVLAAMRKRPKWYADYVERPMGHKRPPLVNHYNSRDGHGPDPAQDTHATDETRRAELAALAVEAIASRIGRGEDVRAVVIDVISTAFGPGTGSESLDRLPGDDCADDERVKDCLADPDTVERIVAVVLDLLS